MPIKEPEDLREKQEFVKAQIEKDVRGYAQGEIDDHRVSLHLIRPGGTTMALTTGHASVFYSGAKDRLIDGTVKGTAEASSGTFDPEDYETRARYYERGYLFAEPSDEDVAFAKALRDFAAARL